MKKKIIFIIIIIVLFISIFGIYKFISKKIEEYKIANAIIEITTIDNLNIEFLDKIKVSDLITSINGNIVNDYVVDTSNLGLNKVKFTYINDDNIKLDQSIEINVIDTVPPVIWLNNHYYLNKGNDINLDLIMCGDNQDENPKKEIIGEYNKDQVGVYPLTYKATDVSGNVSTKDFNLHIINPPKDNENNNNSEPIRTNFNDVITEYKNDNTRIGIDVSGWQGEIDFEKIKDAGVEFIILKIGSTKGTYGDYYIDSKFLRNIELANQYDIDVGIYYYSYAETIEQSIRDAKWVVEQLKDYKIDLPIAFDWENWQYFNSYTVSFYELTKMATSFLEVIEKSGYTGMNYSSKSYLERVWLDMEYPTWLAHYTNKTNYAKPYLFWQLCDNGLIDGINGPVDIDIMYLDGNKHLDSN